MADSWFYTHLFVLFEKCINTFFKNWMKEIISNGFKYDISIEYVLIGVKDFLRIYEKLMKRT